MFKHALVKQPGKSMINGISNANLGHPDYHNALIQHGHYIESLQACGLEVTVLPADEAFPDSVFIEDTAIVSSEWAIVAKPGAESRKGEEIYVSLALNDFFEDIFYIQAPGTLDGGDIMQVEKHIYIGLSKRTNLAGAKQLIAILEKLGYFAAMVPFEQMLHLKTGINYLGDGIFLAAGEFIDHPQFQKFKLIPVLEQEAYAANSLRINDAILVPAGFPDTLEKIKHAGFKTIIQDVSEFRKLDGGLSCLSLRF